MARSAVLTGDIVASSALDAEALKDTISALDTAALEISGWDGKMTIGFARRGGDGWHIARIAPLSPFGPRCTCRPSCDALQKTAPPASRLLSVTARCLAPHILIRTRGTAAPSSPRAGFLARYRVRRVWHMQSAVPMPRPFGWPIISIRAGHRHGRGQCAKCCPPALAHGQPSPQPWASRDRRSTRRCEARDIRHWRTR